MIPHWDSGRGDSPTDLTGPCSTYTTRNYSAIVREGKGLSHQLPALTAGEGCLLMPKCLVIRAPWASPSQPIKQTITIIPGTSTNMSGNIWRGEFIVELDKDNDRGFTPT